MAECATSPPTPAPTLPAPLPAPLQLPEGPASSCSALSVTSLATSSQQTGTFRHNSSGPAPSAAGYSTGTKLRRFASRHVPNSAEVLVDSEGLNADIVSRFSGLMSHLKRNSEWEEETKRVMVSDVDALVPEEYEETLRGEFERRCAYGERMNTELITSAKWIRLLRDIGAVIPADADESTRSRGLSSGAVDVAEADIVFEKVMHNCNYGGKRMTYELFCKSLYLLAKCVRPELSSEAAFVNILQRIVAAAPQADRIPKQDLMLDPNVLLVLDHFKPALFDLFNTFCNRFLHNPASASHGLGTVRLRERTCWKHTQDTNLTQFTGFAATPGTDAGSRAWRSSANSQASTPDDVGLMESLPSAASSEGAASASLSDRPAREEAARDASQALLDFGLLQSDPRRSQRSISGYSASASIAELAGALPSTVGGSTRDPYLYSNGAPVIRDRRNHLSIDQLLAMCRELKVLPDLLTRPEVVQVFKRSQYAGSASSFGSSLYGFLTKEAFVDAAGQLAIEAYSKAPYSDEYPSAHEKISAFFWSILPSSSREVHERFLYGCSGRGR
eukprot:TRINITY_DN33818_c0_g1_i1.p1 TRINITY_DN33818_c0_g1~~TRINITY_DN33818_c0_g1_i1.p1  ORF type:complete len:560 (-),score=68.04 TRINITY_DN33818_c0_g1_i1:147-1826(-)